jgi:hypothetical protein
MVRTGMALTLRKEALQAQIKDPAVSPEKRLKLEAELREVETKLSAGGVAGGAAGCTSNPGA